MQITSRLIGILPKNRISEAVESLLIRFDNLGMKKHAALNPFYA